MTHIVVFVDGSIYSHSVCDHAAWIATRAGSSVEVLHVLGQSDDAPASASANFSGSIGLGARSALLGELAELDAQRARLAHKRGRAILEDARQRLEEAGVVEITTRLRNNEIVDAVQEFEASADLLVIGKRGEAADFNRLHLGSNLERVVRASHRPVLVTSREFKPINRFLVAFDGGSSVVKAVEHLARSQALRGLACTLLSAGNESGSLTRKIEGAAALLSQAGFDAVIERQEGLPEKVIADRAENGGFDLLIMGAYGHSRIRSLIIGSTTTQMLRGCKVPVVLYR